MYSADDTIVALATPPGRGGLAVVRLSGPDAVRIGRAVAGAELKLEPRRATLARIEVGELRDEAVVTWFQAPASFTGEEVVELSLHGSPLVAAGVVAAAVAAGARMARPGEFTLRAFLDGKLDLAQAEAVHDLVSATTPQQARMAFDQLQGTLSERIGAIERDLFELTAKLEASLDFAEEGYHFLREGEAAALLRGMDLQIAGLLAEGKRGRVVREGITAALVGRTNVGKSTVFNRLAGCDRAIVTPVPGTTRDLLTETVSVEGVPVTIVDTAGARETDDPVEREGVDRAVRARRAAGLLIVVLDGASPLTAEDRAVLADTSARSRIVVVNKRDVAAAWNVAEERAAAGSPADEDWLEMSARQDDNAAGLIRAIARVIGASESGEAPILSNVRHVELLERAQSSLREALALLESGGQTPEELILSLLGQTKETLWEVTGDRSTDDLLEAIFSRFCIGK